MKLWIARDNDYHLRMFKSKPILKKINDLQYWEDDYSYRGYFISLEFADIFPEVTFENSPQEVELKLVRGKWKKI